MRIFFSVGEPSGDLHGANLIRALQRQDCHVTCTGFGGPRMQAAGCLLLADLTQFAIMWFGRVLWNLHRFLGLLFLADRYLREQRPDAVVLIDYPGFNWWVARRAKAHGIPVFYYGTPQMWAWAAWRIKKMRRFVDHALCKLPFEAAWYQARGCRAEYVGHPYFDQLEQQTLDEVFLSEHSGRRESLVTLLPGSRMQEVVANLPALLRAAGQVQEQVPSTRFAIASFNEKQAGVARDILRQSGLEAELWVGKTQELMRLATCCIACSGSVSLELLYHTKPTVILYRIPRWFFSIAHRFVQVRFITLVNLLASEQPFVDPRRPRQAQQASVAEMLMPEYPSYEDKSQEIAGHVVGWLTNSARREAVVTKLSRLKGQFAHPGASQRAAQYVLEHISRRTSSPHPATTRSHAA